MVAEPSALVGQLTQPDAMGVVEPRLGWYRNAVRATPIACRRCPQCSDDQLKLFRFRYFINLDMTPARCSWGNGTIMRAASIFDLRHLRAKRMSRPTHGRGITPVGRGVIIGVMDFVESMVLTAVSPAFFQPSYFVEKQRHLAIS